MECSRVAGTPYFCSYLQYAKLYQSTALSCYSKPQKDVSNSRAVIQHVKHPTMSSTFKDMHVSYCKGIEVLTSIAQSQPHTAFAVLTHGLAEKWSFLSRTVTEITPDLQPLKNIIRAKLLPTLTGRPPPNDAEREHFTLPSR